MIYFTSLKNSDLERLNRHTIDVFDRLDSLFKRPDFTQSMANTYPPHNLKKSDTGNHYLIEMAVAGFNKEDITITKEQEYLVIVGNKSDKKAEQNLVYQGIANRSFKKSFVLGEHMKVIAAELKDGMLFIGVEQEVPEEKKPVKIEIGEGKLDKLLPVS